MSRPDSHRNAFVGAAWFAALMMVCIVGLDASSVKRTDVGRTDTQDVGSTQRRRSPRPPLFTRPSLTEQSGTQSSPPEADGDESGRQQSQRFITAKPAVPAESARPRESDTSTGPALPGPNVTIAQPRSDLPTPLRGLQAASPLGLEIIAPVSAVEGEPAPFVLRVRNSTAIDAEDVSVGIRFDERWELPGSEDQDIEQRLGLVPTGESRELTIALLPLRAGTLTVEFRATSATHAPLTLTAAAEVDPRLVDLAVAGPRRRSPGQRGEFLLTVRNTSDRDLPDSRVEMEYDAAVLAVREASVGSTAGAGTIAWPLGTLYRGERVQVQIEFECLAESLRTAVSGAFSTEGRILRASSTALEVVPTSPIDISIVDSDDPWTVGSPARYSIKVRNRGPDAIANLHLRITPSPHFEDLSVSAEGGAHGAEITNDAFGTDVRIPSLAGEAAVTLAGKATAVLPGDGSLRILVQSPGLPAPFELEEAAVVNAPPESE